MKKLILGTLALAFAVPTAALDFRTTARASILYDAPSQFATKVAVVGVGVPLEVFVETESWLKVRDVTGRLVWLEKSALGTARNVMVNVNEVSVLQQPQADAEVRFRASRGVLLTAPGAPTGGWLDVQHIDGLKGWVRQHEVWGQ